MGHPNSHLRIESKAWATRPGSHLGRDGLAIPARNLIANQLAQIEPHLLVRRQRLLDLVFVLAAMIVKRQLRPRRLDATVTNGDDGIVQAVSQPPLKPKNGLSGPPAEPAYSCSQQKAVTADLAVPTFTENVKVGQPPASAE
jgi:hypothetical protein